MENVGLDFYRGKRVFVTGHTGFKGAWLCWWLHQLGAEVTAYALPPENFRGNLFEASGLADVITSVEGDLSDRTLLSETMVACQPDMVFHLAAQPLVLTSYDDPVGTYQTNVMGTIYVLECIRKLTSVQGVVVITTDKCYENNEWEWPYREDDPLGGHDPYSSSKAMVEIATSAYYRSFFNALGVGVATARAGNIIGGGDYAQYRIIPDIIESILADKPVSLRHPGSIRPWQHVLDALYGYLLLGERVVADPALFATSFNFSPSSRQAFTVEDVTRTMIEVLKQGRYDTDGCRREHEATNLELDSSRAQKRLGWMTAFDFKQTIEQTAQWYQAVHLNGTHAKTTTLNQIAAYMEGLACNP